MDLLEFSTGPCSGFATSPALLQVAEWDTGVFQSFGRFCPSLVSRESSSGVNRESPRWVPEPKVGSIDPWSGALWPGTVLCTNC